MGLARRECRAAGPQHDSSAAAGPHICNAHSFAWLEWFLIALFVSLKSRDEVLTRATQRGLRKGQSGAIRGDVQSTASQLRDAVSRIITPDPVSVENDKEGFCPPSLFMTSVQSDKASLSGFGSYCRIIEGLRRGII
ncbi:hypothetical protein OPT61_g2295 [Boeremia exigua]|uniref:Uncharacterized protein n=1 Tax=Boeremia exigua TaxID=749465 RepID=A0ACC2IM80_9PLEO|nr:hypothetical protein OPT61_g2295 [Boeremia exigua]